MLALLLLLASSTAAIPSAHQASPAKHSVAIASHANIIPTPVTLLPTPSPRKHSIGIASHASILPLPVTLHPTPIPLEHSIASHANILPIPVTLLPTPSPRKKKGPNLPYPSHLLVSNLHVIPIQHHIIGDNKVTIINQNGHSSIHSLVPLHELTVIPLHRVEKIVYEDERDRYRNPLGGYGAGWGFGGHGAGHGFHYAYG